MNVNIISMHSLKKTKNKIIVWAYEKDTVSTDKENNEVDGDQDAGNDRPSIGHDSIVHDGCPVLSCEDLRDG